MATTEDAVVVADAGPIIHLDELACLELLHDFVEILIPKEVWAEIAHHRPQIPPSALPNASVISVDGEPSAQLLALSDSLALDRGERAALLLLESRHSGLFLSDDAAARVAAESLGFRVHGTIGILIRSIRTGQRTRPEVISLLSAVPVRTTLHLSSKLLGDAIAAVQGQADSLR